MNKWTRSALGVVLCVAVAQRAVEAEGTEKTAAIPTAGLVGWYPLHGDANDASGGGRHGKVIGATPTQNRFGRENHAYSFNGIDNEIVIAPPPAMDAGALTISLWVRLDGEKAPPGWLDVMDGEVTFCDPIIGQDDGYSIRCWQLWMMDRKLVWHRMGEYHSVWTNWSLETGKWYHVAAVFDGTTHHLFVNGKEEGEATSGILKVSRDEPIRIGSKGDPVGSKRAFFRGAIEGVRIYNRALKEAEVLALSREGNDEAPAAAAPASATPTNTETK